MIGRDSLTPAELHAREYISNKLKELQKQHGYKQADIVNGTGITQSTLSQYMNGKRLPFEENVQKLASFFDVPMYEIDPRFSQFKPIASITLENISDILEKLEENRRIVILDAAKEQLQEQEKERREVSEKVVSLFYDVETVSAAAAASGFGRGFGYDDSDRETIQVDERPPRHDIATRVSGDSMEPAYHDGDILYLVDKGLTTYNGELAVIAYGDRSYFKKIYTEKGRLRLISLNDKYEDIILDFPPAEDTHIKIFAVVGSYTYKEG